MKKVLQRKAKVGESFNIPYFLFTDLDLPFHNLGIHSKQLLLLAFQLQTYKLSRTLSQTV